MNNKTVQDLYQSLGARPIINAGGPKTILGGSRISPTVQAAVETANQTYVDMVELIQASGKIIAHQLEAEAAMVTSGCFGALALGTAAMMTGSDQENIEQLPDTTGMKNEFILQACQRYRYDRALTIFGGNLIEAGQPSGTSVEQLEAAITEKTAGMLFVAVGHFAGQLDLEAMLAVAKKHQIPVMIDAASEVYPLELLTRYTNMGADLVCFGGKYVGAYNGTGILCGRKDLLDAAFLNSFIGYENAGKVPLQAVGRPLKLDRQEIVAVVAALQEWIEMDHEERLAADEARGMTILQALTDIPHIQATWMPDERAVLSGVDITIDEAALGQTSDQISAALKAGSPSIILERNQGNVMRANVGQMTNEETAIVADALRKILS
ncbi:MAG: aminotransferase class V-fold PLP-dependent enzyme [Chloroflexota bacterium]